MTIQTSAFPVIFFCALALMLYATYKAYIGRGSYRKLIGWGALADMAFIFMAMATPSPLAYAGALIFALFQCTARALALSAHESLCRTGEGFQFSADAQGIARAGAHNPNAAGLFALGMLACIGGSPFLIPEGRFFAVQGMTQTPFMGVTAGLIMAALSTTVFVYLHLDAVRKVYLEHTSDAQNDSKPCFCQGQVSKLGYFFAALLVIFGFLRGPMADICAYFFQISLNHAPTHISFIVLFVGAFIHAFMAYKRPEMLEKGAIGLMALAFVCAACFGELTPMARLFALLVTGMGMVITVYSAGYMAHGARLHSYYFFLLLTFAALVGIVSTAHLGAFYGYWELMTFASFFLVVHERTGHKKSTVLNAGNKYYIMCAGGALVMVPGLAMLGGMTGDISAIAETVHAMPSFTVKVTLMLCLVGFAAKAGLLPLHAWLPDAHPAAPSSVSAPLSGIITKMGIFGMLTLLLGEAGTTSLTQHGPAQGHLSWIGYNLSFLGGITLLYGEIMALRQEDIKRILAYSTLGQVGEIVLVLGLGTALSTVAALTHVVNHAVMKDLLFLTAGMLILRTGSRTLQDLRGLGAEMPFTVACMSVGLLGIMGLPPFAGFVGKFLMIQAAMQAGHWVMAALIVVGSLVGAVYYTRILRTLIFEKATTPLPLHNMSMQNKSFMGIAVGLLTALTIILGLFPQITQGLILAAAGQYFPLTDAVSSTLQALNVHWPIYVIVPMLGALVPCLLRADRIKASRAAVAVLLITALLVLLFGRDLDHLSWGFALLVPLMGALNMRYAAGYMEHSHSQWRFYAFFCAMCAGLIGLASAQNLYTFFLFWEIMSSWALYFTIAHEGTEDSLREAFKYFLFNLAGAGCIFLGVCILGAAAPLTDVTEWKNFIPLSSGWNFAAYSLLALGFVMKAAQLPLRIDWQMHPALAPTPVSGFISSVLLKSALLGLMKLFIIIGGGLTLVHALHPEHIQTVRLLIMWVGGITIVMAATQALLSSNLKLIFIYSTVSQIGYMVLALAAGGALGYAGGMLHIINHVFFKDLLFLMCGVLMFQSHKDTLQDLGGIGHKMPFTLTMFAIAGVSVVGLPPSSGFTSKWIIYHALMDANQPFLALLSLIGSVITLAYIAKFLHTAFLGQGPNHSDSITNTVTDAPAVMRMPMTILAVASIVLGIFPGLMLYPINAVLTEFGMQGLDISLGGVQSGPAAWNAANMFIMLLVAFILTWKALNAFVSKNYRITPVHSCGLPPEEATSRMAPSSVYGGLMTFWRESFVPSFMKGSLQKHSPKYSKEQ